MLKRILFVVSEDWYFVSHRMHLAVAAINNGYQVALLAKFSTHKEFIQSIGVEAIDLPLNRRSKNPILELMSVYYLIRGVQKFKPDIIHSVAIKPVLYVAISRIFMRQTHGFVFALGGMGFVFHSSKRSAKILKFIIIKLLQVSFIGNKVRLILQNPDDVRYVNSLKLIDKDKIRLIQGSGVDTDVFFPCPHNDKTPLVILPARMLWDKGVGDFIVCAKYCVMNGINVKFILVGGLDIHNPECVPKKQLEEWVGAGIVEWWGKRKDMSKVYNSSSIVCFPSYHEGLPKSLLEAASCELPIIAYNVPGCREVVEDGENRILVTLKDKKSLIVSRFAAVE